MPPKPLARAPQHLSRRGPNGHPLPLEANSSLPSPSTKADSRFQVTAGTASSLRMNGELRGPKVSAKEPWMHFWVVGRRTT